MKYTREWTYGGLEGREGADDYVTAYHSESGIVIEKRWAFGNDSVSWYEIEHDGETHSFGSLKEAKQFCEDVAKKEAEKKTETKTYTDIWNEAYDILKERGGNAMMAYVYGQRDSGNMTDGDVSILVEDMRDFMVEVVDGRNPQKVPERQWVHEDTMKHDEEWTAGEWTLFCIELGGKFVACAQKKNEPVMMCAEYKTKRGFTNWRKTYSI